MATGDDGGPQKTFRPSKKPFNIHNPRLYHRDPAACGSLLTS